MFLAPLSCAEEAAVGGALCGGNPLISGEAELVHSDGYGYTMR
jgi:hypothetical protein